MLYLMMVNRLQYTGVIRILEAENERAVQKWDEIPESNYFLKDGFTKPRLMDGEIIVSFGFNRKGSYEDIDDVLNVFERDVLSILPVLIATISFESEREFDIVRYTYERDSNLPYDADIKDVEWQYEKSVFGLSQRDYFVAHKLIINESTQH